jgi:hypothetical protein
VASLPQADALVVLIIVMALAVSGCATVPGHPVAATAPPPTPGLSMSIDPCTLLTTADVQQFGLLSNGRDTLGGGRACSWYRTGEYTVGVEVFDNAGLDQLNKLGHTISDHPMGSHNARQVVNSNGGCGVVLEITKTSTVDVDAVVGQDETRSCPLADQYAKLIEPRLPPEHK